MRFRVLAPTVAAIALLTACSGGSSSDSTTASSTATVTADSSEPDSKSAGATDQATSDLATNPAEREKPEVEIPKATPTELKTTDLATGSGDKAVEGSTVTVNYIVVLSRDGSVVDNSYDRGQPFPVTLGAGGVIEGFDQGLIGVQRGTRRQIDMPADLAYGESGKPPGVGPNEALTFVVDVLEVAPPPGG